MPTRDSGSVPTSLDAFTRRADALDVHQLWHTLRSSYRTILAVGIGVFAVVMVLTLTSRMQFRSMGRLYLGELESSSGNQARGKEEIEISAGNSGIVGSEIEIIQSRSLVSKAILESGLNVAIASVGDTRVHLVMGISVGRIGQRRNPSAHHVVIHVAALAVGAVAAHAAHAVEEHLAALDGVVLQAGCIPRGVVSPVEVALEGREVGHQVAAHLVGQLEVGHGRPRLPLLGVLQPQVQP